MQYQLSNNCCKILCISNKDLYIYKYLYIMQAPEPHNKLLILTEARLKTFREKY